jgi:hypothetical protein
MALQEKLIIWPIGSEHDYAHIFTAERLFNVNDASLLDTELGKFKPAILK